MVIVIIIIIVAVVAVVVIITITIIIIIIIIIIITIIIINISNTNTLLFFHELSLHLPPCSRGTLPKHLVLFEFFFITVRQIIGYLSCQDSQAATKLLISTLEDVKLTFYIC